MIAFLSVLPFFVPPFFPRQYNLIVSNCSCLLTLYSLSFHLSFFCFILFTRYLGTKGLKVCSISIIPAKDDLITLFLTCLTFYTSVSSAFPKWCLFSSFSRIVSRGGSLCRSSNTYLLYCYVSAVCL